MELAVRGSPFEHAERCQLGSDGWGELRSRWLTDPDSLGRELMDVVVPRRAKRRQRYTCALPVTQDRTVEAHIVRTGRRAEFVRGIDAHRYGVDREERPDVIVGLAAVVAMRVATRVCRS
jgi:hypothetical protein